MEQRIQKLQDNIKLSNKCVNKVAEKEEREDGTEEISEEIMAKNFPKLI